MDMESHRWIYRSRRRHEVVSSVQSNIPIIYYPPSFSACKIRNVLFRFHFLLWYYIQANDTFYRDLRVGRYKFSCGFNFIYRSLNCTLQASLVITTTPAQAGPGGGPDWPPEVSGQLLQRHEDGEAASPEADLGLRLQVLSQHDRQQGGRRKAARGPPHLPM